MISWRNLSLRTRLSLLYVCLLAISVSIIGGYSYLNVKNLLTESTVSHIRAQAKPVIEHWLSTADSISRQENLPNTDVYFASLEKIARPLATDLTSRNTVALILNREGKVLATGKRLPEEPNPPPPDPKYYSLALAGENEVTYPDEVDGEPVLVMLIPLRPRPGAEPILGVAQISTSIRSVNQILFRHGIVILLVAIITLLIGGELGFALISSTLKYLKKLASTCRTISAGDFSQRINYPHPGDEIGTLAIAFDEMVDRIEAILDSQRRFVANAAHELRTPLTALQGSLEVLLRGSQDDPAAVARLSRAMYREVQRLIRLCEQLLGLSRLESSANLRKRKFSLEAFFDDFLHRARPLVKDRRLTLEKGPFVSLTADPDILNQILLNLLNNAVEHTNEKGQIRLGWKLIPNRVEIWVSDDGEGIAPGDIPHIFEPFYQGKKSGSGGHGGAGLGLALVKAMVEAHRGTMTVESKPGHGATFTIQFPLE